MISRVVHIGIAILIAASIMLPLPPMALTADDKALGDIDPARPIFFNVREEYYNLKGDNWRNAVILRTDVVKLGGVQEFILRFDVPLMSADMGRGTDHGLGDIYTQALYNVYRSERSFFAVGTGLTAPSATENTLGSGKWQVSPLAIPGWWFDNPRALFFIKVQDYVSFAGQSDRTDIHYMITTPALLIRLNESWWVGADTEGKANWELGDKWSFKSGFFIFKKWTDTFGTWIKPEIPWGPNREGDFTIKASFFVNY